MRHKLHGRFLRLESWEDECFSKMTLSMQHKQGGAIQFSLINLFTDGGCRGNPGPGAIGIVIFDSARNLLYAHSECIGHTTNTRAEYLPLIKGLDLCAKFTRKKVCCDCDSELVVNQMNAAWRLKNDALRELSHKV